MAPRRPLLQYMVENYRSKLVPGLHVHAFRYPRASCICDLEGSAHVLVERAWGLDLTVAPPSWRLNAGWKPALHLKLGQHQTCRQACFAYLEVYTFPARGPERKFRIAQENSLTPLSPSPKFVVCKGLSSSRLCKPQSVLYPTREEYRSDKQYFAKDFYGRRGHRGCRPARLGSE